MIKLFYKYTKMFYSLMKFLDYKFFLSYRNNYSSSTSFIITDSLWLIYEWIRALEIKTSNLLNYIFANNTNLSCIFLFFLALDLKFLIPAIIVQIYNSAAKLAAGISTKEAKPEMETRPVCRR